MQFVFASVFENLGVTWLLQVQFLGKVVLSCVLQRQAFAPDSAENRGISTGVQFVDMVVACSLWCKTGAWCAALQKTIVAVGGRGRRHPCFDAKATPGLAVQCCEHAATSSSSLGCANCAENHGVSTVARWRELIFELDFSRFFEPSSAHSCECSRARGRDAGSLVNCRCKSVFCAVWTDTSFHAVSKTSATPPTPSTTPTTTGPTSTTTTTTIIQSGEAPF